MIVCRELNTPLNLTRPVYWALGMCDGVHVGHAAVIAAAVKAARENDGCAAVLTFSSHPLSCVRPESVPDAITPTEEEKLALLEQPGVELTLMPAFTPALAQLSPEQFIRSLCDVCRVAGVAVGEDWRFGRDRAGDVHTLRMLGERYGFQVNVVPDVMVGGSRVSSTRIRRAVHEADFNAARELLGRPYGWRGEVVHGKALAHKLGFPTANVKPACSLLPPLGVYVVRARVRGAEYGGVANLGVCPTVDAAAEVRLETHLFGEPGDIYGCELQVEPLLFLREERKFPSVDALQSQLKLDVQMAKDALNSGL